MPHHGHADGVETGEDPAATGDPLVGHRLALDVHLGTNKSAREKDEAKKARKQSAAQSVDDLSTPTKILERVSPAKRSHVSAKCHDKECENSSLPGGFH